MYVCTYTYIYSHTHRYIIYTRPIKKSQLKGKNELAEMPLLPDIYGDNAMVEAGKVFR